MAIKGKLYLIPSPIADDTALKVVHPSVMQEIKHIRSFLVEDIRSARRFLGSLRIYDSIEELDFHLLNKDTTEAEVADACKSMHEGKDAAVISEAGCPGVADPGARAVAYAHQHDIQVIPLVGPSSLLMALMASGLNGQNFAFHGYLPIDQKEAGKRIKELERESRSKKQTQMFIEVPHRNNTLFKSLLQTLDPATQLSIALDVTGKGELLKTRTVKEWGAAKADWPKLPAVFLFLA